MMQAMEKLDAVNLNIQSAEKIQVSSLPPDAARELIRAPMKRRSGWTRMIRPAVSAWWNRFRI